MSSYMAGVFDLDLDVDTVTVADSDEDDIIEVDEVFILCFYSYVKQNYYLTLILINVCNSNFIFLATNEIRQEERCNAKILIKYYINL